MKSAIIYARYSSASQAEQSIEGQLHVCTQYAKANDLIVVDTYIDRATTGLWQVSIRLPYHNLDFLFQY